MVQTLDLKQSPAVAKSELFLELNHIHLDVVGGIAGDMFIACMCDTFPVLEAKVQAAIKQVLPAQIGEGKFWAETNAGIGVKRFKLTEPANLQASQPQNQLQKIKLLKPIKPMSIESKQSAGEIKPSVSAIINKDADLSHSHQHTTYKALKNRIDSSTLADPIKQIAASILKRLAIAESKIHQLSLDEVHFHELADWDSLMDVVGAATIISELKKVSWSVSKLPYGGGVIQSAHGLIPVPAPATAEILVGFSFFNDGILGERITPTGAAILAELIDPYAQPTCAAGRMLKTGYGGGQKRFAGCPNILRAVAFKK